MISDRNNFSYFRCTSRSGISYEVSSQLAFDSGKEAQNKYSSWRPWGPSWHSDINDVSNLYLQAALILPTKFPVNWYLGCKIDFQDDHDDCHLEYPIIPILAMFDL